MRCNFRSNRRNYDSRSEGISRRVDSDVDPLKEFVERHVENAVRRHKGIGGGFQVSRTITMNRAGKRCLYVV